MVVLNESHWELLIFQVIALSVPLKTATYKGYMIILIVKIYCLFP